MSNTVPKTVEVHKEKLPKGYGYCVTTTDIVDALAPSVLERPIYIRYVNFLPKKDQSWRNLFSVTYRGDSNGLFNHDDFPEPDSDEISGRQFIHAQVVITVYPIEGKERWHVRSGSKKRYLPKLNEWLMQRWEDEVLRHEDKEFSVKWNAHSWKDKEGESSIVVSEGRPYKYGFGKKRQRQELFVRKVKALHPSEKKKDE